jgi:hypothetical protein
VTSDLYGSLGAERFAFIAAHPPYVPTLQPKWIFFSGGEDGEDITRRIVQGLPDHLAEGGTFLALTMGSDRKEGAFEFRARRWLGPAEREFDVALVARTELDPRDFSQRANRETVRSVEESAVWEKLFTRLGTTALVYGLLLIRRHGASRTGFTVRRRSPKGRRRAAWEWLLAWESAAKEPGLATAMLRSRWYAAENTRFHVTHTLGAGAWCPERYVLETAHPFDTECEAEPWMAHALSLCDGHRTGAEVLGVLRQNDVIAGAVPDADFARAAESLVSAGFLELEGFRPPRAEE